MSNDRNRLPEVEVVNFIDQIIKRDFETNLRVLSFDEYLNLVSEQPHRHLRGSAKYALDMMDYFGRTPVKDGERFNVFDSIVVGQEQVQTQLYNSIKTFARQGLNNKLLLLHGPNGSAKTSITHAMMSGLERYSREADGAIYTFNWVFPVERHGKGNIGIGTGNDSIKKESDTTSYARLPDEDVLARIPCDLCDHPLLIIPPDQRRAFLEKLLSPAKVDELWPTLPLYLKKGDLCHRCKQIFEAQLSANNGDFRKVLRHIQVERFYFSRRYRKGLVTIEPQMHVDAQYHQLTYNKISALPPSLQSLNLFTLTGDLVDANRGIVEYSDLLKRPVDSFKYLLVACETGSVNVGSSIAYIDTLMLGSTNEVQLDAFKEFPDFTSFKARIELIRVHYLLSQSQEQQIYKPELDLISGDKHVAPHTGWALALWAVLTRLKKPNTTNYPPNLSAIVSNLSPIDKVRLYDTGEIPSVLSPEDRKILRAAIKKLHEEYANMPYYEGRVGASAREMKSILHSAAQNPEFSCLSPLSVLREIEEFTKRVSEYEFLRQEIKEGYSDCAEFINTIRNEYLAVIDREVRDSIGLYDSNQWEEFLKRYVQNISLVLKKEKAKNPMTGRMEDPDHALIEEFEKIVGAPSENSGRNNFRQNVISHVGAWSLDHPKEPVTYRLVFPDFWRKLEKHYYESQKALLTKMNNALLVYGHNSTDMTDEGSRLAYQTVENMKLKLGYCENCAKEVISYLMKQRY